MSPIEPAGGDLQTYSKSLLRAQQDAADVSASALELGSFRTSRRIRSTNDNAIIKGLRHADESRNASHRLYGQSPR